MGGCLSLRWKFHSSSSKDLSGNTFSHYSLTSETSYLDLYPNIRYVEHCSEDDEDGEEDEVVYLAHHRGSNLSRHSFPNSHSSSLVDRRRSHHFPLIEDWGEIVISDEIVQVLDVAERDCRSSLRSSSEFSKVWELDNAGECEQIKTATPEGDGDKFGAVSIFAKLEIKQGEAGSGSNQVVKRNSRHSVSICSEKSQIGSNLEQRISGNAAATEDLEHISSVGAGPISKLSSPAYLSAMEERYPVIKIIADFIFRRKQRSDNLLR